MINILVIIIVIIIVIMIVGFSLMSVADVLIHSGALLFLGRLRKCDDDDGDIDDGDNVGAGGHLTVLFWDRATHWMGDGNTSTLLESF